MKQHIVCIGSSAASLSCATYVTRLDKNMHVTILTAQSELPNNVCFLADYVAGRRTKESIYLPIPETVEILYNAEVISVDVLTKKIIIANEQEYSYDKLFIGTGLQSYIPELFIPELYKKNFPFKSLDDIVRFEKKKKPTKNVLVVGGGVTGVEAAHALKVRGYEVTLAEKNSRLLPIFNQEVGQSIHELLQKYGITVETNCEINQKYIDRFDTIFLAMGNRPALNFLSDQLETVDGFVLVNEFQQTSVPDIFAGGDLCAGRSLWPQALKDGRSAAYSICGQPVPTVQQQYKTVVKLFNITTVLY